MAQDTEEAGWGNARFRARRAARVEANSADDPQSRFVTGLTIFVVVALAYPWYSYWVQSRLFANEVESGFRQMSAEVASVQKSGAQRQRASTQAGRTSGETSPRGRISEVRVKGATDGRNGPLVVVNFGSVDVSAARETVCQQASYLLGRPLTGEVVRVQRFRGNQPATDAGRIDC